MRVDVQAIEQRRRGRDAAFFMTRRSDPPVDERRGRGLAEVVTDRAEHHRERRAAREIGDALARFIDHHQRVDPHVAFRMPLVLLRTIDERRAAPATGAGRCPRSRASASPTDGRSAASSSFSTSPHTRSGGRSSSGIERNRTRVSSSTDSSNRAANCSARSTRRLSSANVRGSTTRRRRAWRSARPSNGSTSSPVSGSREIALIVKSRRRAASVMDSSGSPSTMNPL